ncbi:hypothetical protein GJ654_16575 [Rhodoblastus acidophilus]|uniref:Uncharacterized protein n=1 Tax=Rhodoblastus acidophilus TaxID=1074 RepID=A0A6N8DTT8_RHOAC|nr:hypothetical protein [Rhodoblastus acidophilus]MCW2275929.1 hypothetical protein [Rhodoblastus acidophilus]MTV32603.1 hypothetical protein [Rhodoblastus acidophilus]
MRWFLAIALFVFACEAHADCVISPVEFFPDRNDHVSAQVRTDPESFCVSSFREGPGYHFTSVSVALPPKHGVIATLGENRFAYHALPNDRGRDSYEIRACADVGKRHGCSRLTYLVTVD